MNELNQKLLSALLISILILAYAVMGALGFNAKADYDCMKFKIPQAQVIGLTTYCGGVWQGTEQYMPISVIGERLEK